MHDPANPAITSIGFLLVEDFALLSYAALIEGFRAANVLSGTVLYDWQHFSVGGQPARASSGVDIVVCGRLGRNTALDVLFVCAGGNPFTFDHATTMNSLRWLAAQGVRLGGVSGGPYLLAQAGLLDGYRCTIHWDHQPAFIEAFPRVILEPSLFVIDRDRLTCAGGTAGLDLAIAMIGEAHGQRLASRVGEWFIRTQSRDGGGAQRPALRERYGISHVGLLAALALMEANIAEPIPRAVIAAQTRLSLRQLERRFKQDIGRSISEEYMRLRLSAAVVLLRETSLTRAEVAVACGFANASHFSRAFGLRYNISPIAARRQTGSRGR